MKHLLSFYHSSVGKKIIMSLSGLFLCTFLVVHAAGNLLLFKNDGGVAFDAYSAFMGSNPVIRTIEVLLFLGILAHVISGIIVWVKNRSSRPVRYSVYKLADNTPFPSRTPMLTASASVVFFFLVVHLNTFWVPERFPVGEHISSYLRVSTKLSDPLYGIFYIVALVFLSYHLKHGFQSGFQTLGLTNKKYQWLIDAVAVFFWLVIPLVFASMPAFFLWFRS
jgi:succinate dehydrogenase / fumarate reductase, cytochrome b subunit